MGIFNFFLQAIAGAVPFLILVPVKAGLGDGAVLARAGCGGCLSGNNPAPTAPCGSVVLGGGWWGRGNWSWRAVLSEKGCPPHLALTGMIWC